MLYEELNTIACNHIAKNSSLVKKCEKLEDQAKRCNEKDKEEIENLHNHKQCKRSNHEKLEMKAK